MPQRFWAAVTAIRAVLFISMCVTAWSQNAVVSGRVSDTSGGVIPNVAVELINRATQVKSPTVTNVEGIFVFPSVIPGVYDVNASATGFNAGHINSVTLEVGQSKALNITLTPGDIKVSVTVTDAAPLITTDR